MSKTKKSKSPAPAPRQGQAGASAELRGQAPRLKSNPQAKRRGSKKKAAVKRTNRNRLPVPGQFVRSLAFECESLAEADIKLHRQRPRLRSTLAEYIRKYPVLGESWERGQLLRNLKGCAAAIMTVSQSAKLLGFERGLELQDVRKNKAALAASKGTARPEGPTRKDS